MAAFHARLEARDPARGCWPAYRIEAGTDLLGDWVMDVTYGRIGAQGRRNDFEPTPGLSVKT